MDKVAYYQITKSHTLAILDGETKKSNNNKKENDSDSVVKPIDLMTSYIDTAYLEKLLYYLRENLKAFEIVKRDSESSKKLQDAF